MRMINSFDKEAVFESLEEAKEYYYPEMEMTEEDYTGDNFAEYLKAWEEYKKGIKEAKSLQKLADVLNRYSNEFDNGSSWEVIEQKFDYFNGNDWKKVSESWLDGVNLDGLKEVFEDANNHIKCVYEDGKEVYYENVYGTWGFPTVFR